MEEGQIGIDELAEKVKRATELIRICRLKLTSTEGDVQKILKDLENSGLDTDSNS
jgi:exodeoxyribonuclease VII small subunit